MPTNDERREIAAKLRELATQGRPTWPALVDLLKCPGREVAVMYLADLIEPEERTCRNVSFDCGKLKCSACGKYTETWYHMGFGDMYADVPNYCPNCGARVVKEDAE